MGPHGGVLPSLRSILQSLERCLGSTSAASLLIMRKYQVLVEFQWYLF